MKMTRSPKQIAILVGSGLVLLLIVRWLLGGSPVDTLPTFEARRGPLTISVTESGTIQSRERVVVQSEVEGRTTIIWLIEEGTQVQKGDLLVQLDSSGLEESQAEQTLRVRNAEAAYIRAREQLEIVRNQAQSDISRAELEFRFAALNQTKYAEGEYPQELQKAEADITLAQEELQRANDKLAWSKRLADEGYLTRMELQADELAAQRATIDLELARGKLNLLQTFSHQQKLEELRSDVEQTQMALERTRLRTAADIVQAEADYRARKSEFDGQQDRLTRITQQIEKCRVLAPADGLVIYVTTGQGRRGGEEPLREGQEVRERQELIYLPTAAAMMADIQIHESSLRSVSTGMPARVFVDAVPGQAFDAVVRRIALLPDAQHGWLNPDLKTYRTEVHLLDGGGLLRPGMNCRAEIIVAELQDAVYVPLQAVIRVDDEWVVHLAGRRQPQPRRVEIGLDNNRMVHIVSGLKGGERVLMNPPLRESKRPERRSAEAS